MEPYRIKHKPTGLYYKPGKSNLSKGGKVYITGNNILNYSSRDTISIKVNYSILRKFKEAGLTQYVSSPVLHIPKEEFEIEYIIK